MLVDSKDFLTSHHLWINFERNTKQELPRKRPEPSVRWGGWPHHWGWTPGGNPSGFWYWRDLKFTILKCLKSLKGWTLFCLSHFVPLSFCLHILPFAFFFWYEYHDSMVQWHYSCSSGKHGQAMSSMSFLFAHLKRIHPGSVGAVWLLWCFWSWTMGSCAAWLNKWICTCRCKMLRHGKFGSTSFCCWTGNMSRLSYSCFWMLLVTAQRYWQHSIRSATAEQIASVYYRHA